MKNILKSIEIYDENNKSTTIDLEDIVARFKKYLSKDDDESENDIYVEFAHNVIYKNNNIVVGTTFEFPDDYVNFDTFFVISIEFKDNKPNREIYLIYDADGKRERIKVDTLFLLSRMNGELQSEDYYYHPYYYQAHMFNNAMIQLEVDSSMDLRETIIKFIINSDK